MRQFFTSFLNRKIYLLLPLCLLMAMGSAFAQVTATEDFEDEGPSGSGTAQSFSQGGISFTSTSALKVVGAANTSNGANNSHYFLDGNTNSSQTVGSIIIQTATTSFKVNSFAAYVATDLLGNSQSSGNVTFVGNLAAGGTATETVNIIASGTGNGVRNGITFTGALANQYITSLTITLSASLKYIELDDLAFTTQAVVTNQLSVNDVSLTEGNSGTKSFTFTVTRTSNTTATTVNYATANGTATAGSDYTAVSGTLTFAANGPLTQPITVLVNGDVVIEGDETFFMNLSNPTGGVILDAQGVGTILEDDEVTETFEDDALNAQVFTQSGFHFSSTGALLISKGNNIGAGGSNSALDTRVGNGGSTGNVGSFSITDAGTSFNITKIDVYTSNNDGATGTTSPVSVTFTGTKADGSGTVSYTASIPAISGFDYQTVNFSGTPLANVPLISIAVTLGSGINYIGLDNFKYGTATIAGTQVSINDVSVLEGTGGGTTTATFTVTRSNNTSAFTVNLVSSDGTATAGSDYIAYPSTTLNFTNGGALSQNVTVTILRDAVIEGNETFNMTLSGATNGVLYLKQVGVGTILDDDKLIETFEDETNGAATFSENTITFSATNRFKVLYGSGSNSGSGSSKGYLSSSPINPSPNTGGSQGKIIITSSNRAFKLLQLDGWTGSGTVPSFTPGPVTFTGTLFGGGTVSTTKTITPTNNTGTGWQQNITFTGTPLENAILTDLEFIAGGSVTTVEIDNINYVAVTTAPYTEITDAANHTLTNGAAASSATTTDFGTVCISPFSVSVSNTFTIKNTGAVNLAFSGSPVAVLGGPDASQFSITSQPAATVAANSSTTFTVKYAPTATGIHNATITLTSNDASNSPYVINIKGTANATATPTATVIQPTCTVATGSITVNSPGGANITYSVDGINYQVSNVFSNLAPGNYNLTAKNTSSGCTSAAFPVTISAQPATPATPTATVTQPTCTVATGTITVNTPTGSGITYSIDNTNYQASNVFNNVAPGNYNVTAKNSSGCVSSALPVTINAAPASPATPTVTVVQPSCSFVTGTITVNSPSGGNITYSIDGTNYQASNTFNNVTPGNYNVTAKNSSGCVSSALPVTINSQPATPATPTVTVTQPSCSFATGSITVNSPTGGNITYSIDGTNYQVSNTFSNVAPGNYNVTAKNSSSGCTSAATPVTINAAPATPATPTVTVTQPTCTVATGTITVNSPMGAGITYSIIGTTYQSSNTFNNVSPGNYNVTARNSSNCTSAAIPVTINTAPAMPAMPTVTVIQPTCSTPGGTITVNSPTGAGITYSIDNTNYQSSTTFSNVAPGNYNLTAKNSSGCVSVVTPVTINAPADNQPPIIPTQITVFLNANGQKTVQPADVAPSITDNCAVNPNSITVSTNNFTCSNVNDPTPHQPFVANSSTGNQNFRGEAGMDFRVNAANGILINQLGTFDHQGNGIIGTQPDGNGGFGIRVAIFNKTTKTIVAGLDAVITSNGDAFAGNYRYKNIPAVTLPQGDYLVVAKGYNTNELLGNSYIGGGPYPVGDNASGAISYLNDAFYGDDNPSGFTYPVNSFNTGTSNIFKAATFTYALAQNNVVTISASDVSGNQSQVNASVTVVDTFYVLTAKNISINLNSAGQATIQPSDVLQSLKNNCGMNVTTSTLQVSPSGFNCSNAEVATPHQPFVSTNSTGNQNFQGEVGMDFRVNAASGILINQLGAFDHQGNGLTGTQADGNGGFGIRVAIFNKATKTIVPGLDAVISGNGDGFAGNYRYKSIAAVTLPQGDYLVIAKGYNSSELLGNSYLGGGPYPAGDNAGGAITYLTTAFYGDDNASGFSYPVNFTSNGTSNVFKAGTFVYKTQIAAGNVVTLTATDIYGHQKQATANVTVLDNSGPVIVTKNSTLALDNTGHASIQPNDVLQSPVTDNCGVNMASISVSPNSFSCADYVAGGNTSHQPFVANSSTGNQNFRGEVGMDFRVNAANGILINQLGTFDHQGNGITGTQADGSGGFGVRVALFNKVTQSIVPGLDVVITGTGDVYANNYRYKNIPAIMLPPGDYLVVAKGYNAGELLGNSYIGGGPYPVGDNAGGAISYLNEAFYGDDNPSGFTYPVNSFNTGTSNIFKAATFTYALNVGNSKVVTVSATDVKGNVSQQTAVVTLTNPSGSCTAQPVMAYAAKGVQTRIPVVVDNVSMSVKVYPNPSGGQFTVELSNLKASEVSMQVLDGNGQVVVQREARLSGKTPVLSIPVDISKHAAGVYVIKVISADGIQTAKVVVSH